MPYDTAQLLDQYNGGPSQIITPYAHTQKFGTGDDRLDYELADAGALIATVTKNAQLGAANLHEELLRQFPQSLSRRSFLGIGV
jgi:hypothetical protein